eukprot:g52420.t1
MLAVILSVLLGVGLLLLAACVGLYIARNRAARKTRVYTELECPAIADTSVCIADTSVCIAEAETTVSSSTTDLLSLVVHEPSDLSLDSPTQTPRKHSCSATPGSLSKSNTPDRDNQAGPGLAVAAPIEQAGAAIAVDISEQQPVTATSETAVVHIFQMAQTRTASSSGQETEMVADQAGQAAAHNTLLVKPLLERGSDSSDGPVSPMGKAQPRDLLLLGQLTSPARGHEQLEEEEDIATTPVRESNFFTVEITETPRVGVSSPVLSPTFSPLRVRTPFGRTKMSKVKTLFTPDRGHAFTTPRKRVNPLFSTPTRISMPKTPATPQSSMPKTPATPQSRARCALKCELNRFSERQLQSKCRELGLKSTGKSLVMVDRIADALTLPQPAQFETVHYMEALGSPTSKKARQALDWTELL